MIGAWLKGRLTVLGTFVMLCGCAATAGDPGTVTEPPATVELGEVACAAEAEELLQPVAIYSQPSRDAALLATLERGRLVYRCERRGTWLAVMYPGPDEPVDCSTRSEPHTCTIGWVTGELQTTIFG